SSIRGTEIDIAPFDTVRALDGVCPDIHPFRAFDHIADIRVQNAGSYTATIRGIAGASRDTITVSREITVR
ncbi:MAG: hypothetical protein ACREM1_03560, partial [Longimicrobiales bacterium]